MKMRYALLGLVLFGASTLALADAGEHHHFKPQSFTEDSTRTFADGTVFKRHVVQTVAAGSITRQITLTNAQGQTATRTVTASFDKTKHTWSRSVQGTTFSGSSYSSSAQGQGEGGGGFGGGHHHGGGFGE